ncbi:CocE/NonD family hydrolase [Aquiflexum sp.]|uniref:CocE/NonD family hydrolase n=1 Tax=Aquiflexum sp. TaxID=1872584 RepID=UPI00359313C8
MKNHNLRSLLLMHLSILLCTTLFAQNYSVEKNIMVPTRDGIGLATDIYFPAKGGTKLDGKFPVIFLRTPYNKDPKDVEGIDFYCKNGYIMVFQDCRGRYKSEGKFSKYVNEPNDGYDAVEWIAAQPWSNGKIGMKGGSYGAHVQASAAKLNPPHLSTIMLTVGGTSNGWTHGIRSYGAFTNKQLTWAFSNLAKETEDPIAKERMKNEPVSNWFHVLPLKKGHNPLSADPEIEDYIFEMMDHADYDDYWKQMGFNWVEYYDQTSDIPMIHISGWYDNYCQTAIDNYLGLSAIKKSPIKLLMGPWTHNTKETMAGDVEFGEDAQNPVTQDWEKMWFDHFLKGEKNIIEEELPVKIFVMGTGDGHKDKNGRLFHGGFWHTANQWPLPDTKSVNYYLHEDGSLSASKPKENEVPFTFVFDPENPVPTIGGGMASTQPVWTGGAFDQREKPYDGNPNTGFFGSKSPYLPLSARKDVMVYQTEPLENEMQITGPIVVKIHASSDCLDTDFTAKLIDVYPPSEDYPSGYEMNLTDGIMRARYRNSPEKAELMEPGKVYEFTITPFPTANVFKKGHRIRIDISSSNFPNYDVNPNTGEKLGFNKRTVKANNTIYHDIKRPSYVVLPIVAL